MLVSTHYMDEAERCHKLAYISYGELLAQGSADKVIQSQHLSTWTVHGDNLVDLARALREQPAVAQTVAFGSTLHVSGTDADALEKLLRRLETERGLRATPIETSLEDVFIYLMSHAKDNFGDGS